MSSSNIPTPSCISKQTITPDVTSTASSITPIAIPPIVHALGGSIGSALSLLLLYPLERARIELQTNNQISENTSKDRGTRTCSRLNDDNNCNDGNKDIELPSSSSSSSGPSSPSSDEFSFELVKDASKSNHLPQQQQQKQKQQQHQQQQKDEQYQIILPNKSKNIKKRNGIFNTIKNLHQRQELYKGATPVAITIGTSNFIYFYSLQVTKKILFQKRLRRNNNNGSSSSNNNNASLLASTIAGVINVLLTNPLWMANLRIIQSTTTSNTSQHDTNDPNDRDQNDNNIPTKLNQTTTKHNQNKMTLWKMIYHILKNEGIKQLWNGTWTSLILVCNPAIQYYIYERCKYEIILHRINQSTHNRRRLSLLLMDKNHIGSLSPIDAFLLGALAKAIATVVTYPLQLAQVLMRLQTKGKGQKLPSQHYDTSCNLDNNHDQNTNNRDAIHETNITHDVTHTTETSCSCSPCYKGTMDCILQLYKQGGINALFVGMEAKLVQTVLTSAFTFLTYEQIVIILGKCYSSFYS